MISFFVLVINLIMMAMIKVMLERRAEETDAEERAARDAERAALAASPRAGDAPKLKNINLAGNSKVSEDSARALTEAREGLIVSFEQPATKKGVGELPPSANLRNHHPSRDSPHLSCIII